jgi:hypothetical protein
MWAATPAGGTPDGSHAQRQIDDAGLAKELPVQQLLAVAWSQLWLAENGGQLERGAFNEQLGVIDHDVAQLKAATPPPAAPAPGGASLRARSRRRATTTSAGESRLAREDRFASHARSPSRLAWAGKLWTWWRRGRLGRRQFVLTTFLIVVFGLAIGVGLWLLSYKDKGWGALGDYAVSIATPMLGEPAGMAIVLAVLAGVRRGRT